MPKTFRSHEACYIGLDRSEFDSTLRIWELSSLKTCTPFWFITVQCWNSGAAKYLSCPGLHEQVAYNYKMLVWSGLFESTPIFLPAIRMGLFRICRCIGMSRCREIYLSRCPALQLYGGAGVSNNLDLQTNNRCCRECLLY